MGKKRSALTSDQNYIKVEVKDEIADSNVLLARNRFQGALRELLHQSDEDSSDSEDDSPLVDYKTNQRKSQKMHNQVRKIKRRRPMHLDSGFHHTYVMKLFDRSVDLAQFEEDTPLYPICRAWIANQPRNPNFVPKVRSPSPELEESEQIDVSNMFDENGDIKDVHSLPLPLPAEEAFPRNRIPSPVPITKEDLDLDYEGKDLKSKEELLKEHRAHWTATRKKWHQQVHKNESRFADSATILSAIFKRAQSEFD
ncbi:protein lin-37 homolog isoform X2 [Copidosoma floridanum]|uniref:protein lin-37 homolog isoform X2 n=1 Tax=Copidosoma floridanum TaxID=29053 RepID=UPI0006C9B866|nr:protein lin-37 homolog isoform X2 [Copidosoma floridanum]